ncbi:hypothetical protein RN001_012513 [Aquatica leii]|uniref:Uncharacterized protein n=1 Tax=Aquatica leii TaxID=1421715 RepID=A0AAN7S7T5_9COLE|nr:hypothetical protein RN001_012513 [Aquatica leii]
MAYYWKRALSQAKLQEVIQEITAEQVENLDVGGDSDADDDFREEMSISTTRSSTASSPLVTPTSSGVATPEPRAKRKRTNIDLNIPSTSKQSFEEDYSSDDSLADKTYQPDDPQLLQAPLLQSDNDDEQPEELQNISNDFSTWEKTPIVPARYVSYDFVDDMGPRVQVVKKTEKDCIIQGITTDKNTWYTFPDETKDWKHHTVLSSKKIILNTTVAIKNINGYRTVGIKLDDKVKKEYFDEFGNFCFKDFLLEEYIPMSNPKSIELLQLELEERIKNFEQHYM